MINPKLAFLLVTLATCARAETIEIPDHERARRLVQEGAILPLATVLESVYRQHPGTILEVQLSERPQRIVYLIEIVDASGKVWDLRVDAKTGNALRSD